MSNPTKIIPMKKVKNVKSSPVTVSPKPYTMEDQYNRIVQDVSIVNSNKDKIINWLVEHSGMHVKALKIPTELGYPNKHQVMFSIVDNRIYDVLETFCNDIGIDLLEPSTCDYIESLVSTLTTVIINITTNRDPSILMDCYEVSTLEDKDTVIQIIDKIRSKINGVISKEEIEYLIKNYTL